MLRAAIANWLRFEPEDAELDEGRTAYHSDIRAIRPDAWTTPVPAARGLDVEQAMWLAGVTSRDFGDVVDVVLSPHLVTPVHDIVERCERRSAACRERACALAAELPDPNPYGRPPLPWHRASALEAQALHRAADAWESLGRALLNNRWHR